jgi:uncharacterized membrane protein YgcG
MKIEEGNADKTTRINNRFSISIILALVIFMISSSAVTMSYATTQTLPTCVDPTGQNLPCIMFISTLPPPKNTLQCQETSGQIFKCTYIVDKLSNGNRIAAITVYVPANFVFSSPTVIKVVEHETTKVTIKISGGRERCPDGQFFNRTTDRCQDNPPPCERVDSSAMTDLDKNLKTKDCDKHDANEYGMTPPPPPCKDNTTCPYINTTTSSAPSSANTSAAIPPNTTSTTTSGGKGTGSTCAAGNCTSGPPSVDCTKNPSDPSCAQTLTPSITAPTTKTCPDGSVIDASTNCPTQSMPPTNPGTPPSTSGTPPSNNGGGGSGSGGGGSGSGSGGGSTPSQPSALS